MMISLKMWCLLPVSVLLLLFITPTVTEVVESMSDCQGFLLENNSPQVPGILDDCDIQDQNRYKIICQTYNNIRRFVTLYDIRNRTPVFSAFKYRGEGPLEEDRKRPNTPWKIEPQLDGEDDKNMKNCNKLVYEHQASDDDYKTNPETEREYDRGHLFPSSYGFDKSDKVSTFTLTNIVPQAYKFNQGSWRKMEEDVKLNMNTYCLNNNDKIEGYVVTGAQPGEKKLKEKVNIPSMIWSAFCCYSKPLNKWIASAYWRDNVQDQSKDESVHPITLQELYNKLDKKVVVFPETKCPLEENHRASTGDISIFNRLLRLPRRFFNWLYGKLTG